MTFDSDRKRVVTTENTDSAPPGVVVERALLARHSCRAFLPAPLEPELMERLFELSQTAPSWCNVQPWELTIVEGEQLSTLSEALLDASRAGPVRSDLPAPAEYVGRYRDRRRESGLALYSSLGIGRDDLDARSTQAEENFRFFGAPHLAILTTDAALGPYAVLDAGVYLGVLLVTAESLGIATIAQAAIAMHSDVVRAALGIPDDRIILCGVSLGVEDADHPANRFRTSRVPLNEVRRPSR